ncbi:MULTISPECIES: hypothetical protein [unclassified Microcoleus]|uniref:hypothetical protein n=1 Tax=unclassified Microcoleus TaxID=2642155 RepID=UPI002FD1FBF5
MIKSLLQLVSTFALTVTDKLKISSMIKLLLQSVSTDFSYETGVSTPGGLADNWRITNSSNLFAPTDKLNVSTPGGLADH